MKTRLHARLRDASHYEIRLCVWTDSPIPLGDIVADREGRWAYEPDTSHPRLGIPTLNALSSVLLRLALNEPGPDIWVDVDEIRFATEHRHA